MIENTNISPFADERKSSVFFDLYLTTNNLLRSYDSASVIKASLVQECKIKQTSIPRSELNITVDNSDSFFNLTDKSNTYYSLNNFSPCEFFLSSVENGKEISKSSFVKKGRLFFESISQEKKTATLKYVSLLGTPKFNSGYPDMIDVFEELGGSTSEKARDLIECGVSECGYNETVNVPDEVNNAMRFGYSSFDEINLNKGFHEIASRISNSRKIPTYLMITDDGTLTLKSQDTNVVEIITNDKFIDYEILPGSECLVARVRDRGNILRQLGDTVEIQDKTKSFKCEIYKQAYNYSNGILSAEWEAVIL